jgi:hypothetical protein
VTLLLLVAFAASGALADSPDLVSFLSGQAPRACENLHRAVQAPTTNRAQPVRRQSVRPTNLLCAADFADQTTDARPARFWPGPSIAPALLRAGLLALPPPTRG